MLFQLTIGQHPGMTPACSAAIVGTIFCLPFPTLRHPVINVQMVCPALHHLNIGLRALTASSVDVERLFDLLLRLHQDCSAVDACKPT